MSRISELTDSELRAELLARGMNIGPISSTTRSVYEKRLASLLSTDKATNDSTRTSPRKSKSHSQSKSPSKASVENVRNASHCSNY